MSDALSFAESPRRNTFETFCMIRCGAGGVVAAAAAAAASATAASADPCLAAVADPSAWTVDGDPKRERIAATGVGKLPKSSSSSSLPLSISLSEVSDEPSSSVAASPEARRARCGGSGGNTSSLSGWWIK
jgi:hypothetical protein